MSRSVLFSLSVLSPLCKPHTSGTTSAALVCVMARVLPTVLLTLTLSPARTQDRLPTMPGYARYRSQSAKLRELTRSAQQGALQGAWTEDGKAYLYRKDGKRYRYEVDTQQTSETNDAPQAPRQGRFDPGQFRLERGRQLAVVLSPDKKRKARYKDGNVWISQADDTDLKPVTTDGGKAKRVFYGTASWVYGEELEQHTAMWWSLDSKKLAYYRFDESKVPDYFVTLSNLQVQDVLDTEPYPKAGAPNPVVELYVYDVETGQNVRLDVRDGKPFENDVVGHYVYNVRWSPDGTQLLFNRTNRLQNVMEFTACDASTGKCRVIVREAQSAGWAANAPALTFLKDGERFVWASERTGWRNLYLYDLSGKQLAALSHHACDVDRVVQIDEKAGVVYYMAHDGDNPMKLQLHRVGLDGTGEVRLTDPRFNHRVDLAPSGKFYADVIQTHDQPPSTRIVSVEDAHLRGDDRAGTGWNGKVNAVLAQGDLAPIQAAGFVPPELLTYKAGDGKTDLYGFLYKPSDFDANKKYPLLVDVYAGPDTPSAEMVNENFHLPRGLSEMGFLVAAFDGRGTTGRGKAFLDAVYGKLGQAEIDDQAAGVKYLRQRGYVDGGHVGIYGTSYGGYASLMCLLRYPDVFAAASASSAVTDWRNYDSIYTERFMGLPAQNQTGYEAASAITHAKDLRGKLLLYYGTADNNVHPSNTLQLIDALGQAGKSYDLQVGPDAGHSGVNLARMLEFFLDALVVKPTAK